MINLLATERKADIRAARVNVIIVRYTLILLLAAAFIMGAFYVSYITLQNTKAGAEGQIAANEIKAGVYSDTRQQVQALSDQLGEARATLDQEVRYSKLLIAIGQAMPAGTVLESLPLSSTTFNGTPVQIKAFAKTSAAAVTLQEHLKASPLFSSVSLQETKESGGVEGYPVVVTMTVVFNKARLK